MITTLVFVSLLQTSDLEKVHEAVSKLKGVVIEAEMVRPSTVKMGFKIARGGYMTARYPTSEFYYSPTSTTTWFPDRRQFDLQKATPTTPAPPGFWALWPTGKDDFKLTGDSKPTSFHQKPSLEIPCKYQQIDMRLFVDPKTYLPQGSIATSQGTEYEMYYVSVKESPLTARELTFKPPKDAKPFSGGPHEAEKLIRAGAHFPDFQAQDLQGKKVTLRELLKNFPKGIVVNFWFSACTGCVQEMPYLVQLATKLKAQKIGFLGVNPIDDLDSAQRTSKSNSLPYPTVFGKPAIKLKDQAGIVAYPVTVVIDPKGIIVDAMIGFDPDRLQKAITRLDGK